MEFVTKNGDNKDKFESGAHRDSEDNKPLFHRIPVAVLDCLQQSYGGNTSVFEVVDTSVSSPIVGFVPESETRADLIPVIMINRLAGLYHRGAKKYGDNNWQKGIPLSRVYSSLFRHMILWFMGDSSEDHLSAIIWNAVTLMWTENEVACDRLPDSLADAGPIKNFTNTIRSATDKISNIT